MNNHGRRPFGLAAAITQDEKNARTRQTGVAAWRIQAGIAVGFEPVDECGQDVVFSGSRIVVSATSG
jgi:hypothetical protein